MFKKSHPWVRHEEVKVLSVQTGYYPENLLLKDDDPNWSRATGVQGE